MMESFAKNKKSILFIILSGVVFTNAIIAEIIGIKIISLEKMMGVYPWEISSDFVLTFDMTAGVIVWPVVFITTDIINEYFGKEGVKKISYLACIFITYIFLVIWIATKLPAAAFWENNDPSFVALFSIGLNIIIASIITFLVSQILDAYVFHYIRKVTGSKKIWLRATGSTLVSQLFDSFVIIFIAFYILAEKSWPFSQVLSVALSNYMYKFAVAILLTPMLYLIHNWIDKYLGKESQNLQKTAANQ